MARRSNRGPASVAIVGPGRLGLALARAARAQGYAVLVYARRASSARRASAAGFPPERDWSRIASAKAIFLTVTDDAVAERCAELVRQGFVRPGQILIHGSGALDLSPLQPARKLGLSVGSLHPLCAVAEDQRRFDGTPAAVDGDAAALRFIARFAKGAELRPIRVPNRKRLRYHAAAVLAANGLVGLAWICEDLLRGCGLPEKLARSAVAGLMASALSEVARRGPAKALTGPVVRGDAELIARELAALAPLPLVQRLYGLLAAAQLPLARERGTPAKSLATIRRSVR